MKAAMKEALKVAMKAKEQAKVDTIRSLLTAIQYEEVAQKVDDLPEASVVEILKREVKKLKEELEFVKQAGREEATENVSIGIALAESFLPAQMSAEQLEVAIRSIKDSDPAANMGAVMKSLKERHNGQYDAKLASELAKRIAG